MVEYDATDKFRWITDSIPNHSYPCGWCGKHVPSNKGWEGQPIPLFQGRLTCRICICPECTRPTIFERSLGNTKVQMIPIPKPDRPMKNFSLEIKNAYTEAHKCFWYKAPTAAVMMCRKLLMHVAVDQGAKENLNYAEYVSFLKKKGYVPPTAYKMVDLVREIGNDANHELKSVDLTEAKNLLSFMEILLASIYEFNDESEKLPDDESKK